VTSCRRDNERQVDTWDEMRSLIRRRFVLGQYYKKIISKVIEFESRYKEC
jgi:hypothetical protein